LKDEYYRAPLVNTSNSSLDGIFGTHNPNTDQVNAKNRVAQAQPNLPTDLNQYGLTIRKSTGLPMMLILLYSPNKTYDSLFIANYTTINVNDALYSVPGVGEVRVFGARLQRVNLEWKDTYLMVHISTSGGASCEGQRL
jgi:multidrug efflux pump subunit AcrB